MAQGPWTRFNSMLQNMASGAINLASGGNTFVATLLSSAYAPNISTQSQWQHVSANEIGTGGGYTQGGIVLGSQNLSFSGNTLVWGGADLTWATFTATFKYACLVKRAGGSLSATDLLIAYCDLNFGGGSITGLGGTLDIQVASPSLLTFT